MKQLFPKIFIACLFVAFCRCLAVCQSSSVQPIAEVPFAFDRTSVVIQVKLNGKGAYNMLLDTGSDIAAIDLAAAKEIGLKLKSTEQQATGGGSEKRQIFLTKISQVEIGSVAAKNIDAVAVDLSKLSQRLGKPLHGVLGYGILKNRIVQFDYSKRVIRFYSASPYGKTAQNFNNERRMLLSFQLGDSSPIISNVYVNGKKTKAVIDTGGGGSFFALMPEAISSLSLEQEMSQAEPDSSGMGVNGVAASRKGKVKTLKIGTITFDSPTVVFYPKGAGKDNRKFGGAFGNLFLQNYIVTFDYPNKTIVFEKP